jgi:hypothetical protein
LIGGDPAGERENPVFSFNMLRSRPSPRADQYNYDLCGVVEEKWDPTSMLFQTILNA